MSGSFQDAQRQQFSILAKWEKKSLIWFASKMPAWVGPDHLTLLGFLAQCGAGICYALSATGPSFLHLVNLLIVLNWWGDSLDGTLARYRQKLRPRYGFYVDHVCDTFGGLFLMGGLSLSGFITPALAWGMLLSFYLLSILVYLGTYALGEFKMSFSWFGPTEVRLLLMVGNLVLLWKPKVHFLGYYLFLFDIGALCAIIGMILMAVYSGIRNTVILYRQERIG